MKPLDPPDSHHLRAAQGWLELGNYFEATAELEKLSAPSRDHPDVLEVRWHTCEHAKNWDACADIAFMLVMLAPDRAWAWIHRSFALHALKRTQEAYDNLLPVAERFPSIWTIPYNLSCYCSQLGRFDEAEQWFKKAIVIDDKAAQRAGIDDPDLKPLWDSMSTPI